MGSFHNRSAYGSKYAGTFLDVPFESNGRDGILTLPSELCTILSERGFFRLGFDSRLDNYLDSTVAYTYSNIPFVRIFDRSSQESDLKAADPFYKIMKVESLKSKGSQLEECRLKVPYSLSSRAKLDPSRIFIAASEDGNSFTLWRNERWFYRAGSTCAESEECTKIYQDVHVQIKTGKAYVFSQQKHFSP